MKIVLAFLALIGASVLLAVGCSKLPSEERAVNAARNVGVSHVTSVSRSPAWGALGGCKSDDVAKFTIRGRDASGDRRTIQVCAPWPFGGYTVRG